MPPRGGAWIVWDACRLHIRRRSSALACGRYERHVCLAQSVGAQEVSVHGACARVLAIRRAGASDKRVDHKWQGRYLVAAVHPASSRTHKQARSCSCEASWAWRTKQGACETNVRHTAPRVQVQRLSSALRSTQEFVVIVPISSLPVEVRWCVFWTPRAVVARRISIAAVGRRAKVVAVPPGVVSVAAHYPRGWSRTQNNATTLAPVPEEPCARPAVLAVLDRSGALFGPHQRA